MIKNPENISVKDEADLSDEKKDAYYSEELSRAAVGRLFDDDEEEEDGPPPIKSAFVTGFDRNPTKKRELPKREPNERFKPVKEEPEASEEEQPEVPREEPLVERHRRRETATTRLLNVASDEGFEAERRELRNSRRRNPAPKPAVHVNVPNERQIRDQHSDPRNASQDENNPTEEDLDTFRRRYNSEELFSPPRNPNRPVGPGRGDVRKNRISVSDRDMDTISPLRMIFAGAAIAVLVLVTILTWQLVSFRTRYNEAQDELLRAQATVTAAQAEAEILNRDLQYDLAIAVRERDNFESILRGLGYDPDAPPVADHDGTGPGDTPTQPTPQPSQLPTTHTVVGGESLNRIALRYFGNADQATIRHIQTVNNISNPNNIQVGQVLNITPMD